MFSCIAQVVEVVYSCDKITYKQSVHEQENYEPRPVLNMYIVERTVPVSNAHGPPPTPYCSPDVTCPAEPTCVATTTSPLEHLGEKGGLINFLASISGRHTPSIPISLLSPYPFYPHSIAHHPPSMLGSGSRKKEGQVPVATGILSLASIRIVGAERVPLPAPAAGVEYSPEGTNDLRPWVVSLALVQSLWEPAA